MSSAQKDADHQRFEHQEGDHVLLHPRGDRSAGKDTGSGIRKVVRMRIKQHRNAVDTHLVGDETAEPLALFDDLEARVGANRSFPR